MYHTEFQQPSMELYTEIGILSDQNEKKKFRILNVGLSNLQVKWAKR